MNPVAGGFKIVGGGCFAVAVIALVLSILSRDLSAVFGGCLAAGGTGLLCLGFAEVIQLLQEIRDRLKEKSGEERPGEKTSRIL